VLPGLIIEHFLKDIEDGKIEGLPSLGIEFQQTLDEQFRDYLGLKPGQGGMFVSNVQKGGTAAAVGVKKGRHHARHQWLQDRLARRLRRS